MLIDGAPLDYVAQETRVPNLSLVPADPDLAGAEVELVARPERERRLRECLRAAAEALEAYDYVFLDCPPSLGLLTVNALVAADERAGAAAMRVLRPGRGQPDHPDHRARAARPQPGARRWKASC